MSNATPVAAQLGWEVYKTTQPRPSLEQINAVLTAEGLGSVSPRMYEHYRKLERLGQTDYMTINELDLWWREERPNAS